MLGPTRLARVLSRLARSPGLAQRHRGGGAHAGRASGVCAFSGSAGSGTGGSAAAQLAAAVSGDVPAAVREAKLAGVLERAAREGDARSAAAAFAQLQTRSKQHHQWHLFALAKGGSVQQAEALLEDEQSARPLRSAWVLSTMLNAYARQQGPDARRKAERLWDDFMRRGVRPDVFCFNVRIKLCASEDDVDALMREMKERRLAPTMDTFSHLMSAWKRLDLLERAERTMAVLFKEAKRHGVVGGSKARQGGGGKKWNYTSSVVASINCLLSIYSRTPLRRVEDAERVVDQMIELGIEPDSWTYNALFACHFSHTNRTPDMTQERFNEIWELAMRRLEQMEADKVRVESLTARLILAGAVGRAETSPGGRDKHLCHERVQDTLALMARHDLPWDLATFRLLMWEARMNHDPDAAERLLERMQMDGVAREESIYHAAICSCLFTKDQLLPPSRLRYFLRHFDKTMVDDGIAQTAETYEHLINAYTSFQGIDDNMLLFARLRAEGITPTARLLDLVLLNFYHLLLRIPPGIVDDLESTWVQMRSVYDEMRSGGLACDEVTYMCMIRGASVAGDFDAGVAYVDAMRRDGVAMTHGLFHSMMRLYLHAGMADRAFALLPEMDASDTRPLPKTFSTLLQGPVHSEAEMVENARRVKDLMDDMGVAPTTKIAFHVLLHALRRPFVARDTVIDLLALFSDGHDAVDASGLARFIELWDQGYQRHVRYPHRVGGLKRVGPGSAGMDDEYDFVDLTEIMPNIELDA